MDCVRSPKKWLILLFLPVPFIFYWYTCLPSVGLADSIRFINDIKHLTLSTDVNNHNLTVLWGWIVQFFPFGDIAYRGNLSCALTGGLAIGIFYISLYSIHRCWVTALVSSLFLMVSHSMWWHSTFLYEYAMNALFITIAIYLYGQLYRTNLIRYLYGLFFLSGLAIFQHYLLGSILVGSTAALVWRVAMRKDKPWPAIWRSTLFFLIGLVPWLLTFIHDVSISHSIAQTFSSAFGGPYKKLYFTKPLQNGLADYLFLIFMQFPSLYLLPVFLGLYSFLRSWKLNESSIGLIFTFIPVVLFEIGLSTWLWSLFAQYLPSFILLAFWASFVIYKITHHPKVVRSLLLRWFLTIAVVLSLMWNVYFYAHLSQWGENQNSMWHSQFNNNFTFNYYRTNEFIANPDKRNYHDISDFCDLVFKELPPHAEYWNNESVLYYQFKLYYQQFYHRRLDMDIQEASFSKAIFAQRIRQAYLSGKDFFLNSLGWPVSEYMSELPDRKDYHFNEFKLNDKWWVYKLVTLREKKNLDKTLWHKWDFLPTDRPVLINLTDDNVLDFHEGYVLFQQNMEKYGPYWENDDQIFFTPYKQGGEIGFLLRFDKIFTGKLAITFTTAPDAGIIEVQLNNIPLTTVPIDLYSQNIYIKKVDFKDVPFQKGNNILTIKVIGHNDSSSSMCLGVDTIEIR